MHQREPRGSGSERLALLEDLYKIILEEEKEFLLIPPQAHPVKWVEKMEAYAKYSKVDKEGGFQPT